MPAVEAVQTFVGIDHENEFYSHHYLSEVFKGDIRERLEQWVAAEEADPEQRAPYKRLASLAGQWFAWRNAGNRAGDAAEQLASFQEVQQGLLQSLGYAITPQHLELQAGMPVPVWQVIGEPGKPTQVLVVPAYNPGQEEEDILASGNGGEAGTRRDARASASVRPPDRHGNSEPRHARRPTASRAADHF